MKKVVLILAALAALALTLAAQATPPVCEPHYLPDGRIQMVCHPAGTPPPICMPQAAPDGGWYLACNM